MSTHIDKLDTISSLEKALSPVLQDKTLYKRLLASNASNAQKLLDSFQRLLDEPDLELSRKNLIVATQRLAVRSGLYPKCHELKDVEQIGDDAVAAGGFADIYKGLFQGKVVCLKMIRVYEQSDIEHVLKKFSNEVMLWAQMNHRNILTIFGLYKFQNRLALVMPWIENGDVGKYLKEHPDAPRKLLAEDVSKGLEYLHSEGVVHGDLKGANILIDDAGRACLADFGISAVSDPDILAWTTQSSGSSSGGSVRWQAPELFLVPENDEEEEKKMKNTVASDVYALGCVFLEIFTGRIPFAEIQNDFAVIIRVKKDGQPARPPSSSPCWASWGMTEDIWSLMTRCWAKEPSHRPSASAITDNLAANRIPDLRGSPETDWISRALFRHEMNKDVEVLSVEYLHDMLSVSQIAPPTPSNKFIHDFGNSSSEDEIHMDDGWVVTRNPTIKQKLDLTLVRTLEHDDYVHCIRISRDGRFLAAAREHFSHIFNTTTGAEVCRFPNKGYEPLEGESDSDASVVVTLCFSADDKYLATSSWFGIVRVWDIERQRVHRVFTGHEFPIESLEFSSDGSFIVSAHFKAVIICYMSNREPKILTSTLFSDSYIHCTALSPNDKFLAIGCGDSIVYIWDITTERIVDRLLGHKDSVYAVAFKPNGDGLVSRCIETIKYWDLTNLLDRATGALRQTKRRKLEREGNWDETTQPDETAVPCVREFIGSENRIFEVIISHDDQWLVSSSYLRVYFWDIHTGIAHIVIDVPDGYEAHSIDISSEGSLVIQCTREISDDTVECETRIWRFNTIDETNLGQGKRIRTGD